MDNPTPQKYVDEARKLPLYTFGRGEQFGLRINPMLDDESYEAIALALFKQAQTSHDEGVREEREACVKEFPMQDGPNIPWWLAEIVYKAYSRLFGNSQSLERLAERGGFGWAEVKVIFDEYKKRFGSEEAQAIRQRQK